MSSSVHAGNNWEKGILILGKGPMQGVDDTTLTAKKKNALFILATNTKNFKFALW